MTVRSRLLPRPPQPMSATLMRSLAPSTREDAAADAGVARPRTPRVTPAPTADFTKSRRPSFGRSITPPSDPRGSMPGDDPRNHVRVEHHDQPHQRGQHDAVPDHGFEDVGLAAL